jgi:7-carboxy-7-deazaguanine synthase
MRKTRIAISEIFTSIDGEVNRFGQGAMTTFIRFAGCSLKCSYCDTKHAQSAVTVPRMTVNEILNKVKTPKITITGGEPLEQMEGFKDLVSEALHSHGRKITIETNGAVRIPSERFAYASARIGWVVDYKLEYEDRMIKTNFIHCIGAHDWIKVIINEIEIDYPKFRRFYRRIKNLNDGSVNFAIGFTNPSHVPRVFELLLKDQIYDVRFNIQIHKFVNMK